MPLIALVVANLLPLAGVIGFDWDTRGLLLLYWAENVVVALWAAARMLAVGGVAALPTIGFFAVHFGIFTFVHLIFDTLGRQGFLRDSPVNMIGKGV